MSSVKKYRKMFYVFSCHETGTKKKFWVPMRFDSSWGLRIFSLSQARDKTKNILPVVIKNYEVTLNMLIRELLFDNSIYLDQICLFCSFFFVLKQLEHKIKKNYSEHPCHFPLIRFLHFNNISKISSLTFAGLQNLRLL